MERVKLKTLHYITCDDVEALTGRYWGEFLFAECAENDSYQVISCSDETLEELWEDFRDIEDELDLINMESCYERRNSTAWNMKCQIELVEAVRKELGVYGDLAIWVSW